MIMRDRAARRCYSSVTYYFDLTDDCDFTYGGLRRI